MPRYTEDSIKQAFIRLLEEKPLNKITVRDIVERCGINRNSFYYHFQDIPTLLEELITEEADRIIAEYPTVDSVETAMLVTVDFAEQNRRAFMHIYKSANRDLFEQHLWKVCDYVVNAYVRNLFAGEPPVPAEDREIIATFYKCSCFGLVIEWIEEGMKEDVHQKIRRFCELRKGMAEEMVRRSREG